MRLPLALLLLLAACGDPLPQGPSVLVITLDTTRADVLGCYGSTLGATPRLDRLARDAVLLERAYAPMAQTLPSHSTLFSGLSPRRHGAVENSRVLDPGVETLATDLSRRGWDTAACIGALVLEQGTGIERGFRHWDQPQGVARDANHPVERSAAAVTDAALWWAGRREEPERPYLLWVHYYDPHGPYAPVQERVPLAAAQAEVQRRLRESPGELSGADLPEIVRQWHGYLNEVAEMDAQVGRLLDGLQQRGALDGTVVLVVADHGQGLMEHGEQGHGATVYEELMLVPVLLSVPGVAPARAAGPVEMRDLLATLYEAAGLGPPPAGAEGRSRWPEIRGQRAWTPQPLVLERPFYMPGSERAMRAEAHDYGFGLLAAIVLGDEKLLREPDGSQRLFDLAADPAELVDLSAERPESLARLASLLDQWLKDHPPPGEGGEISAERREVLRQLGYIGDDG